jgi:hypothetical protein
MKKLNFRLLIQCLVVLYGTAFSLQANAQENATSPGIKFLLSGDAYMGVRYTHNPANDAKSLSFTNMGVNPVFLWKLSNKMIFEGEVEFQNRNPHPTGYAVGEGLEVELEYCNIGYILNDYMILRAGTFFSTMGVFEDWHHQRITNKLISRPLGIGHGGLESGTDLGFNLRGAVPLGNAKMNYSIDLTSGPRLHFDEDAVEGTHAGQLEWEGITDNNLNKAIGGRIGVLPFSNSSLEIGVSAQTSKVGDYKSQYENVRASYYGADLQYNKDIDGIKGTVIVRSQYAHQHVGDINYEVPGTTTGQTYTFSNTAKAWFAQLSYRPTEVTSKVVRRLEVAGRYGELDNPKGSKWGSDKSQTSIGLDYWIAWNAVVKLAYEQDISKSDAGVKTKAPTRYLLQLAMGF